MSAKTCPDDEFIALIERFGPEETAKQLGLNPANVYQRRRRLERIHDRAIAAPIDHKNVTRLADIGGYPKRLPVEVTDGAVIIGSDAHYWPGDKSVAHRGLVKLTGDLKPVCVILNGDVHDGASTSRHAPIGWERKPTLKEELQAVEECTDEIRAAAKGAKLLWTLGNHDMRFENKLAQQAPEFREVRGFCLQEHFPHWQMVISAWINGDVVVKHRFKGGVHAAHNNTLWAGKTMVTGHLHSLKVTPFSDYNGTRYGVDTGTLADPYGAQFDYAEDNPLNHRSGFVVLTFHKGKLLWPEICRVISDREVEFRGQVIPV